MELIFRMYRNFLKYDMILWMSFVLMLLQNSAATWWKIKIFEKPFCYHRR